MTGGLFEKLDIVKDVILKFVPQRSLWSLISNGLLLLNIVDLETIQAKRF